MKSEREREMETKMRTTIKLNKTMGMPSFEMPKKLSLELSVHC
jgi:hypothetical protein